MYSYAHKQYVTQPSSRLEPSAPARHAVDGVETRAKEEGSGEKEIGRPPTDLCVFLFRSSFVPPHMHTDTNQICPRKSKAASRFCMRLIPLKDRQ